MVAVGAAEHDLEQPETDHRYPGKNGSAGKNQEEHYGCNKSQIKGHAVNRRAHDPLRDIQQVQQPVGVVGFGINENGLLPLVHQAIVH